MLTVIVIPSEAVLKEKDLTQTLSILRNELEKAHNDLGKDQKRLTGKKRQHTQTDCRDNEPR